MPTVDEMIDFLDNDIARWSELLTMPADAPRRPSDDVCNRRLTMLRAIAQQIRETRCATLS
jgi:hypothetical protein